MRELFRAIGRLAQAPLGVLITGETGTGKELVARALHRESPRARKPFVALNTAAIPAELLEAELFGHEAGAFTGANKRHIGRFEQADGGTLFLDEIGDMPLPAADAAAARAGRGRILPRRRSRTDPGGCAGDRRHPPGSRPRWCRTAASAPTCCIGSTSCACRCRRCASARADIPLLAERFLAEAAARLGTAVKQLNADALKRLEQHDWPGNIRELENLCWRLAALAPGDVIAAEDLDDAFGAQAADASLSLASSDWEMALGGWARARLDAGERDLHAAARARFDQVLFDAALAHTGGHRSEAAAKLGLGRNTLTRKLGSGRKPRRSV